MLRVLSLLLLCTLANAATWHSSTVTYSADVPKKFQSTVDACFAQWSAASGLKFIRCESADIRLRFTKTPAFDFALGFTTWTAREQFLESADCAFNSKAYRWHVGKPFGVRLRFAHKSLAEFTSVCLHEIGHALGLMHSESKDDVMYPLIYGLIVLSEGDVAAVRRLYGE
jgi:predicted Zn-dependent protease